MINKDSDLRVITLGKRTARALLKVIDYLGPVMAPAWRDNLQGALDRMGPDDRGVRMVVTLRAITVFRATMSEALDGVPDSTYESLLLAFRMARSDFEAFSKEIDNA